MNLDFHYYTTCYLARQAGFKEEEAQILAHSCQMVDDNLLTYEIRTPKEVINSYPTQNYGFWSNSTSTEIYQPFHFFPGNDPGWAAQRKDAQPHLYATSPNSPGVKKLLVSALKSKDLYRIGIALHTFADSWAHQGFSGRKESQNAMSNDPIIPPLGHAQALRDPDIYGRSWEDSRLKEPRVINRVRFREAAKKIYRYLCVFQGRPFDDEELILSFWEARMGAQAGAEEWRTRNLEFEIQDGIPRFERGKWILEALGSGATHGLSEKYTSGYSKFLWLIDELVFKNDIGQKQPITVGEDFYQSHFYRWIRAAEDQRRWAKNWIKSQMGE
jgi:hypothetical protein